MRKDSRQLEPKGNPFVEALRLRHGRGGGAGRHHTREDDVRKGRCRKPKHRKPHDRDGN